MTSSIFCGYIGKLGVVQSKNKHIQMEELEQDGNANVDINIVLDNVFVYILHLYVLYFR